MSKPVAIRPVRQASPYVNMLVFGMPGIGKTRLAGTSPNALILECGSGETDSILSTGHDVWTIHTRLELTEAYEYLRHEGCELYEWVWIDSVSGLEGRLMEDVMSEAVGKNPGRNMLIPDKREYQLVQNTIDQFMRWFCALPINFGATAHVMIESIMELDEDGDEVEQKMYMPQIQGGRGKLSQKICGYMSVVAHMDTVKVKGGGSERSILVTGDSTHTAKDRYDVIGGERGRMLSPTIPKIMSKINGGAKAKPAAAAKKAPAVKATKATKRTGR